MSSGGQGYGGFGMPYRPQANSSQGFAGYSSIFGSNPFTTGQQSVTYNPMGNGLMYQGQNTYKGDPTQTAGYNGNPSVSDMSLPPPKPIPPTDGTPYTLGAGPWTYFGLTDLGQQSNPVTAPPATQQQQPAGQSYDNFKASLSNPQQYSEQQIQDMFQRQNAGVLNPATTVLNSSMTAPNPGKVGYTNGTYGTPPTPQASWFPQSWGAQDFSFNPLSMAGKNVQQNQAWYYGQDAVGRPVNAQGNAYASFGGTDNSLPWLRGGTYVPPWMGGK